MEYNSLNGVEDLAPSIRVELMGYYCYWPKIAILVLPLMQKNYCMHGVTRAHFK